MRQKSWFIDSTCFGHQYAHHQEYNSEFHFGIQTWKAVWVVKHWTFRCVYCSEDVVRRTSNFINGTLFNLLATKLNPSAQRCLPRILLRILIFKGLTVPRLRNSFGIKGLNG